MGWRALTALLLAALLPAVLGAGCTTEFPLGLLDAGLARDAQLRDAEARDAELGADSGDARVAPPPDGGEALDAGPPRCPDAILNEDMEALDPAPAGPTPARGEQFRDPSFGTCITRITDARTDADGDAYVGPVLRGWLGPEGARALLLMGSYRFHLYDVEARAHLAPLTVYSGNFARLDATGSSFSWLESPFELVRTSLGGVELERDDWGSAIAARVTGASEITELYPNSPSADERVWALPVSTSSGRSVVAIDRETGAVLGARAIASSARFRVGVSPSGAFVVIAFAQEDTGPITALDVYGQDLTTHRFGLTEADGASAWDLARGEDGSDVLVYAEGQALMRVDLEVPGAEPVLITDALAASSLDPLRPRSDVVISGAAYDRPGWVVLSFAVCRVLGGERCDPSTLWAQDRIALVSLGTPARVINLAWHRSTRGGARHPHALPNRDLTRVLFDSNWGVEADPVEAYVIELAGGALD